MPAEPLEGAAAILAQEVVDKLVREAAHALEHRVSTARVADVHGAQRSIVLANRRNGSTVSSGQLPIAQNAAGYMLHRSGGIGDGDSWSYVASTRPRMLRSACAGEISTGLQYVEKLDPRHRLRLEDAAHAAGEAPGEVHMLATWHYNVPLGELQRKRDHPSPHGAEREPGPGVTGTCLRMHGGLRVVRCREAQELTRVEEQLGDVFPRAARRRGARRAWN